MHGCKARAVGALTPTVTREACPAALLQGLEVIAAFAVASTLGLSLSLCLHLKQTAKTEPAQTSGDRQRMPKLRLY